MRYTALIAALLLTTPAWATTKGKTEPVAPAPTATATASPTAYGGSADSRSTSTALSTATAASNSVAVQGQIARGGDATSSSGGNTVSGSQANEQNITVTGDTVTYQESRRPASTAYAAPLTAANGTCMGSTSAGGQGVTFGVSFGTTWTDSGCDARYDAQALNALGMREAAIERLCQKGEVAKAIEAAGGVCRAAGDGKQSASASDGSGIYVN